LEHYSRAEALKILLLWRRWLKPGGLLIVETPDFFWSSVYYLFGGHKAKMEIGRHVFGSQEAEWAYHKDFWDAAKFRRTLRELGFRRIRVKRVSNDLVKKFGWGIFNFIGFFLPLALYKRFGGKTLPNVIVSAERSPEEIDERRVVRGLLSEYLVGKESEPLLNVWLKDVSGPE
jgi:hypothetical protein